MQVVKTMLFKILNEVTACNKGIKQKKEKQK